MPTASGVGSPLDYFRKLLDYDLLEFICSNTKLYATQTNVASNFSLNKYELEQLIEVFLCVVAVPGIRRYWSTINGVSQVYEVMSVKRFEEIKRYLHFADNSQILDRLFKIRGHIERIKTNLQKKPWSNTYVWMNKLFLSRAVVA